MQADGGQAAMRAALGRVATAALDIVLPPQCLACTEIVDAPGRLCPACWRRIAFIAPPFCACCGLPFEYDAGPAALCGGCIRDRPTFARARAVMHYDDGSRHLILAFKHGDRTHGARALGAWMARAGAELLADAEVIAPVPLHWSRLVARRYNQSALLAQAVARASGVALVADLLRRTRRTPSQGRLGAAERARNVRGAFALPPGGAAAARDRRVLLVDDVLTSGATANACAAALLRAGAATVDVLVLARAGRPATAAG